MMFTNTKYLKSIHKDAISFHLAGYVYWHQLDIVHWDVSMIVKGNTALTNLKLKISRELFNEFF